MRTEELEDFALRQNNDPEKRYCFFDLTGLQVSSMILPSASKRIFHNYQARTELDSGLNLSEKPDFNPKQLI